MTLPTVLKHTKYKTTTTTNSYKYHWYFEGEVEDRRDIRIFFNKQKH